MGAYDAVIEIPRGSRVKYEVDHGTGRVFLDRILYTPMGYPTNYGFFENTLGEDGDPLDVLLLMEHRAFPGCLVRARLIGVIEAEQSEKGEEKERNDRRVAVAAKSRAWEDVGEIDDLDDSLLDEIEHFFVSYNSWKHKTFEPIGRHGPGRARKLVERGSGTSARKKKGRKKK